MAARKVDAISLAASASVPTSGQWVVMTVNGFGRVVGVDHHLQFSVISGTGLNCYEKLGIPDRFRIEMIISEGTKSRLEKEMVDWAKFHLKLRKTTYLVLNKSGI